MIAPTPAPSGADAAPARKIAAIATAALAAIWAGLCGGALVGLGDGALALGPARTFVSGGEALRFVGYITCLYASTAAWCAGAIALALASAWALVGGARNQLPIAGALASAQQAHHRARVARDPRAFWPMAMMLVGVGAFAIVGYLAFRYGTLALAGRKRHDLIVLISMMLGAATFISTLAAMGVAGGPVARLMAWPLRSSPRWFHALSSLRAVVAAKLALISIGGAALLHLAPDTAAALPVRMVVVTVLLMIAAALAFPRAWRYVRQGQRPRGAVGRALAGLIATCLTTAATLGLSNGGGTVKAAAFTGLGPPLARVGGRLLDLDRDGVSAWFGGGDCDDWRADVHPGSSDIPDDGIDQNCLGGDLTLATSAATAMGAAHQFATTARAPIPSDLNVILITIDTLRADHLSAYGYARKTSPNLDALAARGSLFANAWAHAPSTRYSIPAILTGRLPLDVSYDTSIAGWPGLAADATTLGELAQASGRFTGAILNYEYFDRKRRMDQGFAVYDNDNQRLHHGVPGQGPAHTQGSSSVQQTDKAIAFATANAHRPFFLWVHYYDPHYEYESHAEAPPWPDSMGRYDQEIYYTDLHIGRLLTALQTLGLANRTAILVTGDHGEGFGEHDVTFHGYHLYAAQTKVPFLMYVPGMAPLAPAELAKPVGHTDLTATIADLLGITTPTQLVGLMGQSVLRQRAADPMVWQQLSYENDNELRAVASERCHVIYSISPRVSWQAYDLTRDPQEAHDLAGDSAACAIERASLARFVDHAQVPAGATEALLQTPPATRTMSLWMGDEIELIDVTMAPRAHVQRDRVLTVTWTFAAHGTPPPGYKIFVHAEGPGGRRLTGDHEPARPLAWWKDGQFIRYQSALTIPRDAPLGSYRVWIGAWRDDHRLPLRNAPRGAANSALAEIELRENRAAVASFSVVPPAETEAP